MSWLEMIGPTRWTDSSKSPYESTTAYTTDNRNGASKNNGAREKDAYQEATASNKDDTRVGHRAIATPTAHDLWNSMQRDF
jgi:hypothetical protein